MPAPGSPRAPGYDVAVAGGGAVGAALACALADSGASVLLADPRFDAAESSPAFAPRPIALSLASAARARLAGGVGWPRPREATPIESIHVSEAGRFGAARLEASGVRGREVRQCRGGRVRSGRRCATRWRGASAIHRTRGANRGCGPVPPDRVVSRVVDRGARWHVVFLSVHRCWWWPTGDDSELRDALGIDTTLRDYRQSAIAAVVAARTPRVHTAFERFTPEGPVALLPMGGKRYGLVWSCGEDQASELGGHCPIGNSPGALDAVSSRVDLGGFDAGR